MSIESTADWPEDERNHIKFSMKRTRVRKLVGFVLRQALRPFCWYLGRGIENMPQEGPVLMASNHLTNFDVIVMDSVLPRVFLPMAKAELFSNPLTDYVYRSLGAFPVRRGEKDRWAMRYARHVLECGKVLCMFPEGTRSKHARLKPAKTGAARLALTTNAPILPLAVTGTERMFKPWYRRQTVIIEAGSLLYPQPHESPMELTDRIMYAIAAMLPESYRGVYAEPPPEYRSLFPTE